MGACIGTQTAAKESTDELAQETNPTELKPAKALLPPLNLSEPGPPATTDRSVSAGSPGLSRKHSSQIACEVTPPPVKNERRLLEADEFEGLEGVFEQFLKESYGQFSLYAHLADGVAVIPQEPVCLVDGTVYTGEWNCMWQRHGRGRELMPDGSRYIGYFEGDQRKGKGRLICPGTYFYEGDFRHGEASGYGEYCTADGSYYKGQFRNNLQEGRGKETYPNGCSYRGSFKNGEKSGRGVFKWPDGSVYSGTFLHNLQHGTGTTTWASGKSYTGQWRAGKMHGSGVFAWTDGREFRGHYVNGLKHGAGKFVWPSGKVLEGTWENGVQEGLARVRASKKSEFQTGLWRQGQFVRWVN